MCQTRKQDRSKLGNRTEQPPLTGTKQLVSATTQPKLLAADGVSNGLQRADLRLFAVQVLGRIGTKGGGFGMPSELLGGCSGWRVFVQAELRA